MTQPDSFLSPLSSPQYASRLMAHLQSRIETVPRAVGESYEPVRINDLVHPKSHWVWDAIHHRGKLHKFARHIRSSQTFAINLFGALPERGIIEILSSFFGPISEVEQPEFEFEDEQDRLRESVPRGQRTQVDVVLRGQTPEGQKVALLIEVKLSEVDFGNCSGAEDPMNDSVEVCRTPGPFGSDSARCYKLRNHGGAQRRLYDQFLELGDLHEKNAFDGCWYRTSGYQPMRNVALAEVLRRDENTSTLVAVCAPLLHRSLWAHFNNVRKVLPRGSIVALPAELVASLHDSDTYEFISSRYFFEIESPNHPETDIEIAAWEIVASIDEQYHHRLRVYETQPGGGQYDCISLAELVDGTPRVRVDLNRLGRVHVIAQAGIVSIDSAWDLARAGNSDIVARMIGEALGLTPRSSDHESPWRFFGRVVRLGRCAGETIRWRNTINENSQFVNTDNYMPDWRLERHGGHYSQSDASRTVYEGFPSRR